jgi:hypothetical protein
MQRIAATGRCPHLPVPTVRSGGCGETVPKVSFQVGRGRGPVIPVKTGIQVTCCRTLDSRFRDLPKTYLRWGGPPFMVGTARRSVSHHNGYQLSILTLRPGALPFGGERETHLKDLLKKSHLESRTAYARHKSTSAPNIADVSRCLRKHEIVIPAKAGIQCHAACLLDPRLRGDDDVMTRGQVIGSFAADGDVYHPHLERIPGFINKPQAVGYR